MFLYEFFKNLFSLPNNEQNNIHERESPSVNNYHEKNDYRNNLWDPNGEQYENTWGNAHRDYPNSNQGKGANDNMRNFNIYTDPLEMHKYFEQQMNEILKSFNGFLGQDSDAFFGFDQKFNEDFTQSPLFQTPNIETKQKNLRDQFLKPGYEYNKDYLKSKTDVDVDGQIKASDLDSLLKIKSNEVKDLTPYQEQNTLIPYVRSFSQSISSKTVQRPDGTIEIHRIIRDNSGNEETTVTKRVGDKHYSVTIKTDAHGIQEKTENILNIDEKELAKFTDNWTDPSPLPDMNRWFPFDKYFK